MMKLDGRYVSGLKYGLGGDLLVEKFENLSNFLFGMERVTGWTQVPHLVKLGDDLLRQLRFQHFFCTDGTKRSELQEQLLIASEDPVEKANALIVKKKRARPPTFVKKLNVGNRFQFQTEGKRRGGLTSTGEVNRGNPFYRKSAWSCKFVQPGTVQEQKSIEGRSVVENGVRPGTVQERKTIASRSVRENTVRPGTVQERKSITNRSVSGNSVRPGTVQERESITSRSVSGNSVQPGTVQERKSITSRSVSGNSVQPGTVQERKNITSRFPKENGVQPGAVQERKSIESRYVNENSVRPGTVQERNSSSRRSINNKTSIHIVRERSSIRPAQCGGEHHSADVVEGGPEWKGGTQRTR